MPWVCKVQCACVCGGAGLGHGRLAASQCHECRSASQRCTLCLVSPPSECFTVTGTSAGETAVCKSTKAPSLGYAHGHGVTVLSNNHAALSQVVAIRHD